MIAISPDPAIADLLKRAASGDMQAQRDLVDHALQRTAEGYVTTDHGIAVAEAFARMAATHGGRKEQLLLSSVLFLMSAVYAQRDEIDAAAEKQAEAVAFISDLADHGDEEAANQLQVYAHTIDPGVLIAASDWVKRYSEEAE
ncbi:hypothetical protein [Sphingomonas montanisoli]|uniref:Uncharacterized protein n=1 Tax=Sphingomonas montanisoli TaxID=2606412 RepID=A0A5D9C3L8_9SPHN|nr:hypothetical protein [Sphingomonas montanisoli]TZG25887.1 hypothetical protein FYJ91_12975 [Sphingomonas montanisoli]